MLFVLLFTALMSVPCVANAVTDYRFYKSGYVNRTLYCPYLTVSTYSDGEVAGCGVNGYKYNYKYASCSSYRYNASSKSFVSQYNVHSSHAYTQHVSTYENGTLTSNANTDRRVYYSEIYNGGSTSGLLERIWYKNYRNSAIAKKDGDYPGHDV